MMDPAKIKGVVEKAVGSAEAAGFGRTEQIEHAVRVLREMEPTLSEENAITAVRRVMRPD
jgi:hypothetical protein